MANYGNAFTYNSGNFKFTTNGHQEDDDNWAILNAPLKQISYKHYQAEAIGNNVTTYGVGDASLWPDSIENFYNVKDTKNGTYYYTYFEWRENKNLKGSISGAFSCYAFDSKNSKFLLEPTRLNDFSHGIPANISINTKLYMDSLSIKGTRDTRGYRKNKIKYTPDIDVDYTQCLDGTSAKNATVESVTRYDAFQTFYNCEDPYGELYVDIFNVDDSKSSTPTFCTISDLKSEYKINHSYTYNPYIDTATWNKNIYLSFSHNLLSTYNKSLVLTYPSNYNNISYNGGNFNIEAKAYYNNSYDGFTTSTATDVGFTSYKRYVDISYRLIVNNSSTEPSGLSYDFRVWQPGSELKISYHWSIDEDVTWANILGSKNIASLTISPQDSKKGSISGKIKIDYPTSGNSGETYTSSQITGVTFTSPNNGLKRSCTVRQNMEISNCYEQNITPKDENGQPYQIITVTQNPAVWEEPKFKVRVKCVQLEKTNKPVSDNLNFGWPRFYIGQVWQPNDRINEYLLSLPWKSGVSKQFYVKYPTINAPHTLSDCSGSIKCVQSDNNMAKLPSISSYVSIFPNITFKKAKYEGYSERKWVLSCTSIEPTVALDNKLEGFDPITFTMNGVDKSGFKSGIVTIKLNGITANSSPIYSNVDEITMSTSDIEQDETLNYNENNSYIKSFNFYTNNDNSGYIGTWKVDIDESGFQNVLKISSTSYNSKPISMDYNITASPSENGKITLENSNGSITLPGSNIIGKISIHAINCGLCNDMMCFTGNNITKSTYYPVDGKINTSYYFNYPIPSQKYINGIGDVEMYFPVSFKDIGDINTKNINNKNNYINTNSLEGSGIGSGIGTIYKQTSVNASYFGGTYNLRFAGIPSIESEESRIKNWSVYVHSNIGDYDPIGGNPVSYGSVAPNDAKYTYQIQIDDGSWIDLSYSYYTITLPNIKGDVINNYGAYLVVDKTYTDVKNGIYKYIRGRYTRSSTVGNTYTIKGRVVDYYDNNISYNCTYNLTLKQLSDFGDDYYTGSKLYLTNDNDWNCTVGDINDTTWDSDNDYIYEGGTDSDAINVGSFDVTPDWFASHTTPPTGNNTTVSKNYVSNYKDGTQAAITSVPSVSVTFIGSDKEFGIGETISYVIGVSSATPDSISITNTWVGQITWTYKYRYSIYSDDADDNKWFFTTKEANASYSKPSVTNTYYKYIKYDTEAWTRFTDTSSSKTVTSLGTHTVYVCWAKSQSDCDNTSNRKNFKSHSVKLTQQSSITEYEYQVIVNISVTSGDNVIHDGFTTEAFTSSVTAVAEGQARSRTIINGVAGNWGAWEKWIDLTPTVTYSGVVSGNGNTATGAYNAIGGGTSGSNTNSGTVTFTASATWNNAGGQDRTNSATKTVVWSRYGISYNESVDIKLNEILSNNTKIITAFDDQTWTPLVITTHSVTAKSGTVTKDVTSNYNTPSVSWTSGSSSGTGSSYTLTAVQGSDGNNTGSISVTFKATGSYDSSKTATTTAILKCYGKSYYNA